MSPRPSNSKNLNFIVAVSYFGLLVTSSSPFFTGTFSQRFLQNFGLVNQWNLFGSKTILSHVEVVLCPIPPVSVRNHYDCGQNPVFEMKVADDFPPSSRTYRMFEVIDQTGDLDTLKRMAQKLLPDQPAYFIFRHIDSMGQRENLVSVEN